MRTTPDIAYLFRTNGFSYRSNQIKGPPKWVAFFIEKGFLPPHVKQPIHISSRGEWMGIKSCYSIPLIPSQHKNKTQNGKLHHSTVHPIRTKVAFLSTSGVRHPKKTLPPHLSTKGVCHPFLIVCLTIWWPSTAIPAAMIALITPV